MKLRLRVLLAVILAGLLASAATASPPPHYVYRDVAFVTMDGHGTVTSTPRGIACPRNCRGIFIRGTHLQVHATPAPGWKLASFTSRFCKARNATCAFDLVSPHDCIGGACPVGAFGLRVAFVRQS
jgi:hypothetical protein